MEHVESDSQDSDPSSLTLPSLLDMTAAGSLCGTLLKHLQMPDPIVIDGAGVERVSTAAVQVLMAAAADARSRGLSFRLHAPSEALTGALADLGLHADLGF